MPRNQGGETSTSIDELVAQTILAAHQLKKYPMGMAQHPSVRGD
jgi:hypothetical protein